MLLFVLTTLIRNPLSRLILCLEDSVIDLMLIPLSSTELHPQTEAGLSENSLRETVLAYDLFPQDGALPGLTRCFHPLTVSQMRFDTQNRSVVQRIQQMELLFRS